MILVTGGAGYIGSHIVDRLNNKKVVILDDFSNADFAVIDQLNARRSSPVKVVHGSINDKAAVAHAFSQGTIKSVIHCAGLKSVAESNRRKAAYTKTNVDGTIDVMIAAINYGVKSFIFSSSASVYAPQPEDDPLKVGSPLTEESPTGPISHYGATKLEAEKEIFSLAKEYASNIRVCALRYFNPIGAYPFHDRSTSNLVPALCSAAVNKVPLRVFGNEFSTTDGSCDRDYITVDLLAKIHLVAVNSSRFSGIINIGVGEALSVFELRQMWMEATGVYVKAVVEAPRKGDVPRLVASNALLRSLLKGQSSTDAINVLRLLTTWNTNRHWIMNNALASQYAAFKKASPDDDQ